MLANPLQIRLDRLHLTLKDWARRFGPVFPIRIGPRRIAVISERAVIRPILAQRPDGFRRTRMLESVAAEMGLRGVSAAEGEDWRTQRRIVVAALSYARIDRHVPKLNVTVRRLRRRWERAAERGEAVDPCRDLMRASVDVTMRLAFGIDANTLETPEPVIQRHLGKVFPVLHRRVNAPFAYRRHLRLPLDRVLVRPLRRPPSGRRRRRRAEALGTMRRPHSDRVARENLTGLGDGDRSTAPSRSVFGRLKLLAELRQMRSELHGVLGSESELKTRRLLIADPVLDLHPDVHRAVGGGELAKPHLLKRGDELYLIAHGVDPRR